VAACNRPVVIELEFSQPAATSAVGRDHVERAQIVNDVQHELGDGVVSPGPVPSRLDGERRTVESDAAWSSWGYPPSGTGGRDGAQGRACRGAIAADARGDAGAVGEGEVKAWPTTSRESTTSSPNWRSPGARDCVNWWMNR